MTADLEEIVAFVPSSRDPTVTYTVTRDPETGELRCDCPGWFFSLGRKGYRTCRHVEPYQHDELPRTGDHTVRTRDVVMHLQAGADGRMSPRSSTSCRTGSADLP